MYSTTFPWEAKMASSLEGESLISCSFSSRMTCDDATMTTTTPTATATSSTVPSIVSSSCFSDTGALATFSVGTKDAGLLFQEKIRLLKESMQKKLTGRGQEWRGRDECAGWRADNRQPKALLEVTATKEVRGRDDAEAVATGSTPVRGNAGHSTDRDDGGVAMDLMASPSVVVVVVDSPSRPVGHRDASTMTVDVVSTSLDFSTATATPMAMTAASTHGVDDCGGNVGVNKDDHNGVDTRRDRSHSRKEERKKLNEDVMRGVSNGTNPTGANRDSVQHLSRCRRSLTSPFAATTNGNSRALAGSAESKRLTGKPNTTQRKASRIQTLRAPSESSSSRFSSRQQGRGARLQLLTSSSDSETGCVYNDADDDSEPAPPSSQEETVALTEHDLERLMQHCEDSILLLGNRSMAAGRPVKQSVRVLSGRKSMHRGVDPKGRVLTETTRQRRGDGSLPLQSCSLSTLVPTWVQEKESLTPTEATRPSLGTRLEKRQKTAGDDSAAVRQRRCLLRQIRLLDAEIYRMEQVPWSKSLRSGTGSVGTLRAEKAKLLALRKQYESELEHVVKFGVGTAPSAPSAPLLSSPLSVMRPVSSSLGSAPRHGPSVYQAVLQQQQQQRQEKGGNKWGVSRATGERRSASRSTVGGGGGDAFPAKAAHSAKTMPCAISFDLSGHPVVSQRPKMNHKPNDMGVVRGQNMRGTVGCRRSFSIDAEKMAALYARGMLSTSSQRERMPVKDVTTREKLGVAGSNSGGGGGDDNGDDVPLYWRVAQKKRNSDVHSGITRHLSLLSSSCGSTLTPSNHVGQPALGASERGSVYDDTWCGAGPCADVAADQYYCTEYEEDDAREKSQSVARGGRTNKGVAAARRSLRRPSSLKTSFCRSQQQHFGDAPRVCSGLQSEVKSNGATSFWRKGGRERSDLCYRLHAPVPHEARTHGGSKRLCFLQDPPAYGGKSETIHAVPQSVNDRHFAFGKIGGPRAQERANCASSSSCVLSQGKQGRRLGEGLYNLDNHNNMRGGDVTSSRQPVLSSFSGGCIENTGHYSSCDYSTEERNNVTWISPARCLETPPVREQTPPPPTPPLTASSHSQAQFSFQKDQGGRSLFAAVHYDPEDATDLCGREQRLKMMKQRTPVGNVKQRQQQQQQQQYHQHERQPTESPSGISDIRVSPLTEYSGHGSPTVALSLRVAPSHARSSTAVEKEPDFRRVMSQQYRCAPSNGHMSPLRPQEERSLLEGVDGCEVALPLNASPSSLCVKGNRRLGDDLTNDVSSLDGPSALPVTRRVGAGGITLRQLFGYEPRAVSFPQVVGLNDSGRNSTDVLLSRITQMRAQMQQARGQ